MGHKALSRFCVRLTLGNKNNLWKITKVLL
jgi:hypothetical protein